MKIKEKIDINDLYFGYKIYDLSYTSEKERKISTHNLFGSSRVLYSVATWVTMSDEEKKKYDAISWCFSDVRGRCEYEFVMAPWAGGGKEKKVDVYQMYVEPNRELLLDIISRVTVSSAKKYLSEKRKSNQVDGGGKCQ